MKVARAIGGAGIEALTIRDEPIIEPGPGEALVRLRAATLNFRDLLFITGRLPNMTKQPDYVPLSCSVGEVVAIGDDVERVSVGERVTPIFSLGWIRGPQASYDMLGGSADGVARQYATFPAESLCHVPDQLGDFEGATLTCAGLTAWSALTQYRTLQPGDWVLAHGTGGVSIAALQFAKAMGANVAITSSSYAKLARAEVLGADVMINYRTTPDWEKAVRDAIGGNEVAIVVDTVGVEQFDKNAALLREDGQLAAIGMLGSDFSWSRMGQGVNVVAISVGNRDQHEEMVEFIAEHRIRPVVDVVYDLERLADAYRHLESGKFFAKIGVTLL
ncbi:MAG: NAD(P)-dependent alcohol dehydrogenase [Novosphingobium sp.]|nr:NAD(P)-dependent alcohol dehydrogenase [Novosphingobium sp.]